MKKSDKYGCLFWVAVIIMMWSILLLSCKSNKPLVSTNTKVNTEFSEKKDIAVSAEEKTSKNEKSTETKFTTEDENIFIFKVEYDTDKPVNPETGNPPVKSKTLIGKQKATKENTESVQNITESEQKNTNIEDKSMLNEKNNTEETVKQESPKDPYRYRYIFYIALVVICIIVYCFRLPIVSFIKKLLRIK